MRARVLRHCAHAQTLARPRLCLHTLCRRRPGRRRGARLRRDLHARSRSSRARRTDLHRLQHVVLGAFRMHRAVRARGLHRGLSHAWRIGLGATRMSAGRCSHAHANARADRTRCARTRCRTDACARAHADTRAHRRADAFARTRCGELELPGIRRVFVVDGRDARRVCVACLDASPQGEMSAAHGCIRAPVRRPQYVTVVCTKKVRPGCVTKVCARSGPPGQP